MPYAQPLPPYPAVDNSDQTVSIGKWIGVHALSLLNIVPLIGTIGYVVALCVIAFGGSAKPSLRNYAKSLLIIMAVALIISVSLGVAFWASISEFISVYTNITEII
jgi:hypothetical protein